MGTVEIKTYLHKCDRCGAEVINNEGDRPDLWGIVYVHDCGSTGYTRDELCCKRCFVKAKKKGEHCLDD